MEEQRSSVAPRIHVSDDEHQADSAAVDVWTTESGSNMAARTAGDHTAASHLHVPRDVKGLTCIPPTRI